MARYLLGLVLIFVGVLGAGFAALDSASWAVAPAVMLAGYGAWLSVGSDGR